MIAEAPFLFSIAGLSASLAGLAGLVAALRRGADLRPIDSFRLREIVEFAFANILLCVFVIPAAQLLTGGTSDAARIGSIAAIAYLLGTTLVLVRRMRTEQIHWTVGWRVTAASTFAFTVIVAIVVTVTGWFALYEVLLVLLLARPMLAFLLVLGSFEGPSQPIG